MAGESPTVTEDESALTLQPFLRQLRVAACTCLWFSLKEC